MNPKIPRRKSLARITKSFVAFTGALPSVFVSTRSFAQSGTSSSSSQAQITQFGQAFLEQTGIPGLSVAFARHGEMVHQEAFGLANLERKEKLTAAHSFRIASVSKPITATVIYALIEQGKLKPTDRVFGPQGILSAFSAAPEVAKNITVQHLLHHSAGGWGNRVNDPMFHQSGLSHRELIDWTLKNLPLSSAPGTNYEYSNFGYCLLGRLIEQLTGKSYAQATKELILSRAGISKMHIAGNDLNKKAANEVRYYAVAGQDPYAMNLSRMDSHGGWVATPGDIVKFAISVDGFRPRTNLLQASSIAMMTRPSQANPGYASGWAVNNAPNWWHTGSLPGTSGIVVRTASGMCWAACANARTKESVAALDDLMWKMARSVAAWQA